MITRNLQEAAAMGPSAVTIGNFDGVHLGHRALVRQTIGVARGRGLRAVVMMFDPHPARIIAPDRAPRLLTSMEERCALLIGQGIDDVLILPFTLDLARLTPEEFVTRYLRDTLQARLILVGRGFRFGHKQAGNAATLEELGGRLGFATQFVEEVDWRGRRVSASEVRKSVLLGDVSTACRLLGRPHSIAGEVVHGHGIGSRKTVPTLNLDTQAEVLPARGVYITRATDLADDQSDGRTWNAITNVGYRPTFGGDDQLSIETFLLSPFDGRTPEKIRLDFLRRVRDERKFESPEVLKAQIMIDVKCAQTYFRRLSTLKSLH